MTPRQFFDLVCEMRKTQKAYFDARKQRKSKSECDYWLKRSVSNELAVDTEIERVNHILNKK